MILRALGLAVSLLLFPHGLVAQSLPEPLSDTVSDFAEVLDPAAEARIAGILTRQREATGVQMVVVTMPAIEAFGATPGQRLDAYAKALFNAWGVGGAERNDGILMLVETEAREVRIALGAGYDAVYDGRAARVLSTAVLPEFRAGRLAEGIEAGIASSRDRLIAPFLEGRPVTLTEGFEAAEDPGAAGSASPWLLGGGGLIGLLGYGLWRNGRKRRTCPRCGELTLTRRNEVIEAPSGLSSGTGLEHILCSSCGYTDRQSYTISPLGRGRSGAGSLGRSGRSGSGGRSSGGFGGGRSSGGGASGKW
jgi:uncharacterized protein